MRWRVALALVPSLAGCYSYRLSDAVRAPPIASDRSYPTLAHVCVLRTSVLASAVTFVVHDNGQLVGATRGAMRFCYLAAPGDHVITTASDETEVSNLTAIAGRHYYLHEVVDNIFGYVRSRSLWVTEREALELADDVPYRVLLAVPGAEALPRPMPFASAAKRKDL
ncbi:MAG: hypothetical protein NVS3B20_05710 [Polyangiales bacterium]